MHGDDVPAKEAARRCVLYGVAQTAKIWGHSDAVGYIRGTLLLADGPLSMDELVEMTGYSKSTVSTCMSILEDLYFVRRIIKPGDKRHYYVSVEGVDAVFDAHVENMKQSGQIILSAISQAEQYLAEEGDESEVLLRRLEMIREDISKIHRLMELAGKFSVDGLIRILEQEIEEQEHTD